MKKIIGYAGVVIIILMFVAAFVAYFVTRHDPVTGGLVDGWGRPLSESPFLMRMIFGQERLWAGWLWFVVDFSAFFGGITAGGSLAQFGLKEEKSVTQNP